MSRVIPLESYIVHEPLPTSAEAVVSRYLVAAQSRAEAKSEARSYSLVCTASLALDEYLKSLCVAGSQSSYRKQFGKNIALSISSAENKVALSHQNVDTSKIYFTMNPEAGVAEISFEVEVALNDTLLSHIESLLSLRGYLTITPYGNIPCQFLKSATKLNPFDLAEDPLNWLDAVLEHTPVRLPLHFGP